MRQVTPRRSRAGIWRQTHVWLERPVPSLPLALFRVAFGLLMFAATLRFMLRGWVTDFYVTPQFHFTYLGFGWVKPLPEQGMYVVFGLMLLSSLLITAGLFYRVGIVGFFLLFTYIELLDKSFYLNHYYFVSLLSFLLIFLPLNRALSLDVRLGLVPPAPWVPAWTLYAVRLQLVVVYLFAGFAKLNPDWLFAAQPLRIWLRASTELPVIGFAFDRVWVAYAMSWAGLLFDLSVPFLLLWKRTRLFAYSAVVAFHVLTALLFSIGMFPWIMMVSTLLFFSGEDVGTVTKAFGRPLRTSAPRPPFSPRASTPVLVVVSLFFLFQTGMSLRHTLYPGNVLWTEEGYRFSWRVMLAEKTGRTVFEVRDDEADQTWTVYPSRYLTPQQTRQMAFQPDMILQFAHFLRDDFAAKGYRVAVYADAWVSLNGRASQPFVQPVDLATQPYSLAPRRWLEPERNR